MSDLWILQSGVSGACGDYVLERESEMVRKLYPNGKRKAFNITYDDGILQDVRFVELLNKYGLKGTFNLNSELMRQEFEWVHESGRVIKRLPERVVVDLYRGHEVASHSLTHPDLQYLSEEALWYELGQDKRNLEEVFGCENQHQ